jgi:hypothetical protein
MIYAEAYVRGAGNASASTAVGYVNDIRERAGLGRDITQADLTPDDADALQFILDERGREFLWEGQRRSDLIRFGLFAGNEYVWSWKGGNQNGTSIDACRNLYPLPAGELAANPNLPANEDC